MLDRSPRDVFEANARTLRWVGRHLHLPHATADIVRAATAVAACEKVIVATEDVRYSSAAIGKMCDLLEIHEAIEPQDYLDPLPWWSAVDAGRMLIHRGIESEPDHDSTFGFRRSAARSSELFRFPAPEVFVRREPRPFSEWLGQRPKLAGDDFVLPVKTAFFLSLIPVIALFAIAGGVQLATGYASAIAFMAVVLAVRGRSGAAAFFPLRACLFAPLWVLERSVSVYWALFRKLRGVASEPSRLMPERSARSAQEPNRPARTM
jgi:hypothetical protein